MKRLNEENVLTKGEVRNITKGEIADYIKKQEFKKAVKEISADAVKELFRVLWQNSHMWHSRIRQ